MSLVYGTKAGLVFAQRLYANVAGVTELPLNWKLLPKLWKPDTFFINGKKSKLHKITASFRTLKRRPNYLFLTSQIGDKFPL